MRNYDMPERTRETIRLYLERGLEPGGFVTAVLSNDLFEAFATADLENRAAMFEIVRYVYNELPIGSWGSREKVRDWLTNVRRERREGAR